MMSAFSKREVLFLLVFGLVGLISFVSGFDYWLAEYISNRPSLGVSLFFSYWYYIAFEVGAVALLAWKRHRAFWSLLAALVVISIVHSLFTWYLPRERPAQAMPIGDELMEAILDFGASSSFPSGHSASTVAIAATYTLAGIHGTLVWMLGLPIICSRVTLVHHHLSDVVGGCLLGYVVAKMLYVGIVSAKRFPR